jgi:hypothetical protein
MARAFTFHALGAGIVVQEAAFAGDKRIVRVFRRYFYRVLPFFVNQIHKNNSLTNWQ